MSLKNRKPHGMGFSPAAPIYALIIVVFLSAASLASLYGVYRFLKWLV